MKIPNLVPVRFPEPLSNEILPHSFYGFCKDVFEVSMMIDILNDNSLIPKKGFNRSLDIGGGEGFCSLLLKNLGVSKNTTSIDPLQYRKISKIDLIKYLFKYKKTFRKKIQDVLHNFEKHFDYKINQKSHLFRLPIIALKGIDNQIYGAWERANTKYDFISCLLAYPYFSKTFFKDCIKSLNSKGVLFLFFDYYYSQTNSIGVDTGVPWNLIFLNQQKIKQIVPNKFKKYSLLRLEKYGNHWKNKTLSDIVQEAKQSGFEVIYTRRHMSQKDNERIFYHQKEFVTKFNKFFLATYAKARKLNKNVTKKDLHTSFLTIILRKKCENS